MLGTLDRSMGRPKRKRTSKSDVMKTVGVRCTVEWAEWLERAAQFCRLDQAKLLDISVADYLKARGFDEPPPPRL
jgi:hypothetical protein